MAKSGYKKFKKQEKAKVKLKGNKTLLPKGQNVTDTNFKVKKIIVKEQLKEHSEQELLSRKHLNIKDLISRLNHHNVSMRQDALSGLKELVTSHGSNIVQDNLSSLLQATMTLTNDRESDVRKDTLKLLSVIFDKVTEKELSPLFPVVICHLTCGMTHIEPSVRADSLRLLDILLSSFPTLTSSYTPTLLPHFLDLISHQSVSGQTRTLSLHLDGRVTSEKWRSRVIGRLNKLFSVIWENSSKGQTQTVHSVNWRPEKHIYLGLYNPVVTSNTNIEDVTKLPMQDYTMVLMPLLLDTFTEAAPKQDQEETQTACIVGLEVTALLQSIVEVILHIWNLLKHSNEAKSLTEWFQKTWGESVVTRLLKGRFPYSVTVTNSRKRQRDADKILAALQVPREPSCSLLNMQLCLLVFLLTRPGELWTQSIHYIKRSLRGAGSLKPEESDILCQCLEASSNYQVSADLPSLLGVVSKSEILNSIDKPVNRKALEFLTSVALLPSHHLHNDNHFTTWLDSLPALLCRPFVSLPIVHSIITIATRNLPAFTNSLDGWVEEILGNLATLTVTGDSDKEGHKLIIDLIYWVTDWDHEVVQTVAQLIQQGNLGQQLTNHLVDVLRLKVENTEDPEVKKMMEKILPQ